MVHSTAMPHARPLFADSLSKFISVVTGLRDNWRIEDEQQARQPDEKAFEPRQYWYRGVSKANYDLKPKMYRKSGYEAVRKYARRKANENEITRAFKSSAAQLTAC